MADAFVEIDGDAAVVELLDGYAQRIKRWTRMAPSIQRWLLQRQVDLFRSQGKSEGVSWQGYSREPKYKAFKQSALGDLTVMRWKGGAAERLYPSLTDKRHPEHVFKVGSRMVEVGTRVPHAARLERGGKNMFGEPAPARPIAVLGDRSRARLVQLMAVYIARGDVRGNQWER